MNTLHLLTDRYRHHQHHLHADRHTEALPIPSVCWHKVITNIICMLTDIQKHHQYPLCADRHTRAVQKDTELFFFNLLLYLQLNQTCLLQSTPLYCWYTAPSVFSSSGTCFAGWREGPVANFLLSLPSEIGDLLGWTSTLVTGKSPQGPNLESSGAGARQSSLASPKIHG